MLDDFLKWQTDESIFGTFSERRPDELQFGTDDRQLKEHRNNGSDAKWSQNPLSHGIIEVGPIEPIAGAGSGVN